MFFCFCSEWGVWAKIFVVFFFFLNYASHKYGISFCNLVAFISSINPSVALFIVKFQYFNLVSFYLAGNSAQGNTEKQDYLLVTRDVNFIG